MQCIDPDFLLEILVSWCLKDCLLKCKNSQFSLKIINDGFKRK